MRKKASIPLFVENKQKTETNKSLFNKKTLSKSTMLKELNEDQREAAVDIYGPSFIVAGPGGGKTKVIVSRTAYMIEEGINPKKIVLFTFTRKAAEELKNRVTNYIGKKAKNITVGTYHSVCVKILRQYCEAIGYKSNFSIYDAEDSKLVLKKICESKEIDVDEAHCYINNCKIRMISVKKAYKYCETQYDTDLCDIYNEYVNKLKKSNVMDFDDLILNTIKLLKKHYDIREKVNNKYQYIIADEGHDSSKSDTELLKLLTGENKNICIIIDDDQCLLPDTPIETIDGKKLIKDITTKDLLIVAKGRNKIITSKIDEIKKNLYEGKVIKITTQKGKTITATPNHIIFGRMEPIENMHYVYLMYKDGYGYRIGRTSSVRTERGRRGNGFEIRLRQEHGDKIWIIGSYNKLNEAIFYENYYSYKYGIPQYVFKNANKVNALRQDEIRKLFDSIDTEERAEQLLKDKILYIKYPHHVPQANSIKGEVERFKLSFTMFGSAIESKQYFAHELSSCTKNENYSGILSKYFGLTNYKNGNGCSYKLARITSPDHDRLCGIIENIESDMQNKNLIIQRMARLTNKKFNFMPISNLIVGSIVAIKENDTIIEDRVTLIETLDYKGYVYDINVPDYRNYIANDIVVHNSIYGFRGADLDAVMELKESFDFKIHILKQNYRSTQTIVKASRSLIEKNPHDIKKELFTKNEEGAPILMFQEKSQNAEAIRALKLVLLLNKKYNIKYKDIVILYRMHYMSRELENLFVKENIPYKIVNGIGFYKRKEIKDILCYVRFLCNFEDEQAFRRIINIPKRGIGDVNVENIIGYAEKNDIDLLDACKKIQLKGTAKKGLENFNSIIETLLNNLENEDYKIGTLIEDIIDLTSYIGYLESLKKDDKTITENRKENINELINAASQFEDIQEFVENIVLNMEADDDEDEENNDRVQFMTMHSAKGLEFKAVIIIGCNEGICPHFKAKRDKEIQEERRLFYVSMTRAELYLFLIRAEYILNRGTLSKTHSSRFLDEIDEQYLYIN